MVIALAEGFLLGIDVNILKNIKSTKDWAKVCLSEWIWSNRVSSKAKVDVKKFEARLSFGYKKHCEP